MDSIARGFAIALVALTIGMGVAFLVDTVSTLFKRRR